MKIISNNTRYGYTKNTLRVHARELNKFNEGYENNILLCEGYITALFKNKLINNCEKKWLHKIYVEHVSKDDGLGERYGINKSGEIEDYNEDELT